MIGFLVDRAGATFSLSIDDRDRDLLLLLYLHSAAQLEPSLPRLSPAPNTTADAGVDASKIDVAAWREAWNGLHHEEDTLGPLRSFQNERVRAWRNELTALAMSTMSMAPEQAARRELADAADRGLRKILVIPSDERWHESRSAAVLMVSRGTRVSTDAYRTAIRGA